MHPTKYFLSLNSKPSILIPSIDVFHLYVSLDLLLFTQLIQFYTSCLCFARFGMLPRSFLFHQLCLSSFLPNPVLPYSQSPDYQIRLQLQFSSSSLLFFISPFFLLTQRYTSQQLHHHQFYDIDISTCSPING